MSKKATLKELQDKSKSLGLKTYGKKDTLLKRIPQEKEELNLVDESADLDKNCGWYEGFADGNIPSTDNGLESVNRVIKDSHTLRDRMPISQYLVNAMDMIRDWSLNRFLKSNDNLEKPFFDFPNIDKRTWTSIYWKLITKINP